MILSQPYRLDLFGVSSPDDLVSRLPQLITDADEMFQILFDNLKVLNAGGFPGQLSAVVDDINVTGTLVGTVLTLGWTGTLAVERGGTNSGASLSGDSLMISNGSAIVQGLILTDTTGQILNFPGTTAPSTPAAGRGSVYAATAHAHTRLHWFDENANDLNICRDNAILVQNISGGTLTKGTVVDIYSATGQVPVVRAADNTDVLKHGEAILQETLLNNAYGLAVVLGYVQSLDTSAFTDGDVIYTGTAGAFVNTIPAFPAAKFQQRIGVVVVAHATQGIVLVDFSSNRFLVDLTADVTGVLPIANGGMPPKNLEAYISLRVL